MTEFPTVEELLAHSPRELFDVRLELQKDWRANLGNSPEEVRMVSAAWRARFDIAVLAFQSLGLDTQAAELRAWALVGPLLAEEGALLFEEYRCKAGELERLLRLLQQRRGLP
ncbi:hypothetical protein [Niveibacterium sp. SC-1]|uniref:hypothetical protein n=1 Tax=Niveibacterium sp. SC-1 TaxID=3135646 RepID=UPI00311F6863